MSGWHRDRSVFTGWAPTHSLCTNCKGGMRASSIQEIKDGKQICPCGAENPPNRTIFDVLEDLQSRVEILEMRECPLAAHS